MFENCNNSNHSMIESVCSRPDSFPPKYFVCKCNDDELHIFFPFRFFSRNPISLKMKNEFMLCLFYDLFYFCIIRIRIVSLSSAPGRDKLIYATESTSAPRTQIRFVSNAHSSVYDVRSVLTWTARAKREECAARTPPRPHNHTTHMSDERKNSPRHKLM